MQLLKKLLAGLAALMVLLIGVGFLLPRATHVERSKLINATPATLFPLLNNMHEFNRWSPWSDLDPAMVTTYAGPMTGVGAKMTWAGNAAVGSGSQEIVGSVPGQSVKMKLMFGGSEHPAYATFTLAAEGVGTRVVWSYDGDWGYDIVSRYLGLMLDRWIGPEYAKGLDILARLAESEANAGTLPAQ